MAITNSGYNISPNPVNPGQEFTVSAGSFSADSFFTLSNAGGTESLKIHTSCSQVLEVGNVFGSLTLVAFNGQRASQPVTYFYKVTNNGDPLTGVSVTDNLLGPVAGPFSLGSGQSQTFQKVADIFQTTTNTASASGFLANGAVCPVPAAQDSVTVAVKCSVVGGSVEVKDRQFKWALTNNGSSAATLTSLTLVWPQGNGKLLKVKFGKDVIWDQKASWTAGGLTLTSADFTTDVKKKSIDPGKSRMLTLEFEKNASSDLSAYTVNATFDSRCNVKFVPPQPPSGGNFCQTAPGSGRAKTLTMFFVDANGGDNTSYNCTTNCNTQDPSKVIVTGDPAPATQVWIRAVPTGKSGVLFEGLVDLDESFVMSAASAGLSTFDTNATVTLYRDSTRTTQLSSVQFHTSCSQPLNDGDYYGSLRLTGFTR